MLGRPPTASDDKPLPPERMVSAKVQVASLGMQLPVQPLPFSSGLSRRQTTDGSVSTFASVEKELLGVPDHTEVLQRLTQVDRKLEEMMGLMYSCLDGIDNVKQVRPATPDDEDGNASNENSRPSTGHAPQDRSEFSSKESVSKDAGAAWASDSESPASDSPRFPNDDAAWKQPSPLHISSTPSSKWLRAQAGFQSFVSRTWTSRFERKESTDDNISELSPTTRTRRVMDRAKQMFRAHSSAGGLVWQFLEESDSSLGAKIWSRLWCTFVCAAVLLTLSQTMGPNAPVSGTSVMVLETIIEVVFLVEVVARLATCPDMKHFLTSIFNMIDMASAMPLALRMASGFSPISGTDLASDPTEFLLVCVVPIFRLLKILRREDLQFQLFEAVVDSVRESLQFLGFVGLCLVLTFAAVIYLVEPRDNIESYGHACWLTIITMTTVGYGDVSPVTDAGRAIISVLVVTAALYMALPIGVLGNAFAAVWKDRDLIMLIDKVRRILAQWGYKPLDIKRLLEAFDLNGDGELDLSEFRIMMKQLRVNLKDERIVDLFEVFDKDRGGSVDAQEFLHVMFPRAWHDMVQKEKEEEEEREAREKEEKDRKERERKDKERKERRKRRACPDGLSPRSPNSPPSPRRSPRLLESNLVHNLVEGDAGDISTSPAPSPEPAFPTHATVSAPRAPCPHTTLTPKSASPSLLAFSGKGPPSSQKFRPDMLVDEEV